MHYWLLSIRRQRCWKGGRGCLQFQSVPIKGQHYWEGAGLKYWVFSTTGEALLGWCGEWEAQYKVVS